MTTLEVAQATGASLRQLQWWDEQHVVRVNLVPGMGAGGEVREYSEADLMQVRVVQQLRAKGMSLQKIRRILPRVVSKECKYVVIANDRVIGFKTCSAVVDFAAEAKGMVAVLSLGEAK